MYLIEVEAGREERYDSLDALASAIRSGDVGPTSRIFHRASSSWVSITVHPAYRQATAVPESEPLPPLQRKQWTFYGLEPKAREVDQPRATGGDAAGQAATEANGSGRGWRRILNRAFRTLSISPRTSEPPGS